MSRWFHTCEVCGQFGPYGFYHQRPDGTHGRLWACEAHSGEVRSKAGAVVPASAQAPPREPVHIPVPDKAGEQKRLF